MMLENHETPRNHETDIESQVAEYRSESTPPAEEPRGEAVPPPGAWQEVMAEVSHLRSEVAELNRLRAEVARLHSELAAARMAPVFPGEGLARPVASAAAAVPDQYAEQMAGSAATGGSAMPARGPRWSRRGLLLGAAGAAAGATAAVAGASPAAATTGTMRFGADNDAGPDSTSLLSSHSTRTLRVENQGSGSAIEAESLGAFPAIRALGSRGVAIYTNSIDASGMVSTSGSGAGLEAYSSYGPAAALRSVSGPTLRLDSYYTGAPTFGSWVAGDVVAAKTDGGSRMELWVCVASGSPGLWRQLAGTSVAGGYVPIKPIRVFDSRWSGVPGVVTGPLLPGTMRTVSLADARDSRGAVIQPNSVPRGTLAVTLNVTVVDTLGRGNLALVPDGAGGSETSSINWSSDNQVLANGLTVGIVPDRRTIDVLCRSNRTNAVIDITGYYSGA